MQILLLLQGETYLVRPALHANGFTNQLRVYSRAQTSKIIWRDCEISSGSVATADFPPIIFTLKILFLESFTFRKNPPMVHLSVESPNHSLKKKVITGTQLTRAGTGVESLLSSLVQITTLDSWGWGRSGRLDSEKHRLYSAAEPGPGPHSPHQCSVLSISRSFPAFPRECEDFPSADSLPGCAFGVCLFSSLP